MLHRLWASSGDDAGRKAIRVIVGRGSDRRVLLC